MPDDRPDGLYPALPPGFMLGTVSAAYAVEGGTSVEGRGPSIWDTFTRQPGAVVDGATGEVAADGYRRWQEDLDLLQRLGAPGHRFSISWSRVLPTGHGQVSAPGLDHYDRLVDGLLARGIEPTATLYHWDLPEALEDDGGWLNPATVDAFATYAGVVGERLADRVAHWIPVNAPNIASMLGYGVGVHAPGRVLHFDALWAVHHLLLAHGRGVTALRAAGATSIGCANNHAPIWPASDSDADVGATKMFDAIWNGMFLEPMLLGRYPVDLAPLMEEVVAPGDLATIRQPLDFYGVSYYRPLKVAASPDDAPMPFEVLETIGHPTTGSGWAIVPDALREWLIMFRARFRAALPPIVVTECGATFDDQPGPDGIVDDAARIDFLRTHLRAVNEAVQRGVDVRGFFVWTLLDSFTWSEGLSRRYGLVHVDHATLTRTPKQSFDWYAGLVAAQSASRG